ncbi:MAG: DUF2442 domain-containing protein [Burkholderiales bacterium]|nr:DUF2442 domain-containing protein [Burkholderiales bacterium]MBK9347403.1 DUF2442 domain-containing protein [Burkholderiales bacterium]
MEKVVNVSPAANGHVLVALSNNRKGLFDVRPYMNSAYFEALKDPTYFKQVRLVFRGIGWPDGQDLGPDTIAAELIEAVHAT